VLLTTAATTDFKVGAGLIGIIGIGIALDMFSVSAQYLVLAQGKASFVTKVWTLAALANILLNIALIPFLGIFGAALATLLTYIFAEAYFWKEAAIPFTELVDIGAFTRFALAAIGMAIPLLCFKRPGVLPLTLAGTGWNGDIRVSPFPVGWD